MDLLAKEKGWGWWRKRAERARAQAYLATFHATLAPPPPPPRKAVEDVNAPVAAGGSSGR